VLAQLFSFESLVQIAHQTHHTTLEQTKRYHEKVVSEV